MMSAPDNPVPCFGPHSECRMCKDVFRGFLKRGICNDCMSDEESSHICFKTIFKTFIRRKETVEKCDDIIINIFKETLEYFKPSLPCKFRIRLLENSEKCIVIMDNQKNEIDRIYYDAEYNLIH